MITMLALWLIPAMAAAQALPSGWSSTDIGQPTPAGSASHTSGTFTVKGSGADIWGTSDQFRFVYRRLTGDGVIVARVATLQHADPWSKAGVMVRDRLTASSKFAMALVSGTQGIAFQRRTANSASAVHTAGPFSSAPQWLKLERTAGVFKASSSVDGATWQVIGSNTISMSSTVYVGLAVTSHRPGALATATFTNVAVTTAAPINQAPTVSITTPAAGATVSGTVSVAGTATDDVGVAKVEVRVDAGSFALATGTSSWSYAWNTAAVADGTHTLTARVTDTGGLTSTASVTVNVANGGSGGGGSAAGSIPTGFPRRFTVGLYEEHGNTWMRDSGVRWDARYRYFTHGWVNNWGWSARDGSWGLSYLRESSQVGMMPVVQYYVMNGVSGYNENAFYATTQNAAKMADYFDQWKILMQRVRDFGQPAVIIVEADGFGFLQQQTGGNPNAYAAVAATGMAELANLPNTVAGWGLAFLELRAAVGAHNAILAMDISGWSSGKDLFYFSVTDALQPEVDKTYAFLAPLGLTANVTGATWDLLANNPLDRDSDYYTTLGQNRWWDAGDGASVSSRSFNRFAEWLRLWNVKAGKRWVLWQVPEGNSNHLNVYNNGAPRQGYKDNRPEYFFGTNGDAHRQKFANAGVIGIYFGPGTGGMSFHTNDTYTDGQLFIKSRAGAFLNTGGLPID
jgi:regulation of enolase protein 1 (concanavalin A-like superfamily)